MSTSTDTLRDLERMRAGELLWGSLLDHHDRGAKWTAFLVAILIHALVLAVQLPEMQRTHIPKARQGVIVVKKYIPPPPRIEKRQIVKKKITRMVPLPDPTPDEPEPIREPNVEIVDYDPIPPEIEIMIGVPEAPPPKPKEVLLAGVGDVTNPVLIQSSKVKPHYPELARAARMEGRVVLQAIINRDGSVGSLELLSCSRPGLGFEESALEAVQHWHYEPALQNGHPVEVYFTVIVTFILQSG